MKGRKNNFFSAFDWVVYDVRHASFECFTYGPLLLSSVFFTSSTVPHAEITWEFGIPPLLAKQKINHFKVNANYSLMRMIFEQINDYFDIIMLFLQNSGVTNRNSSINISIVHLRIRLELSKNNRHSPGSYEEMLNCPRRPGMSLQ